VLNEITFEYAAMLWLEENLLTTMRQKQDKQRAHRVYPERKQVKSHFDNRATKVSGRLLPSCFGAAKLQEYLPSQGRSSEVARRGG